MCMFLRAFSFIGKSLSLSNSLSVSLSVSVHHFKYTRPTLTAIQSIRSRSSMKVLNVAEKNDAAKSIAAVMSRNGFQRREGYSQYNKIYQFDYMLHGQHVTMNMTSVSGHLQDLEFTGQYRNWQSCNPLSLFEAPIIRFVPDRYEGIKRTLEREARGAAKLIIWTDCDREGENIGFEIIDVVTKANPRIQVLRAKFSEITNTSINRAIANLIQPDKRMSDAVQARQELDLRIGAAFTRFLTLRYQAAFPELANLLLSYGSCQFPTLGFVVERYKQIQEFVPEPFWKLKTVLEEEGKKVDFNWKRVRLFDYDAVLALYESCIEQPEAQVIDVKKKSKSKWRPVALDTVEFEKNMCKKLKMSAKRAMQIAEKLYTSGYISYPRTETNQFPKELNLRELVQNQTIDGRWGDFAGNLLQVGITPRNGNKSDQAHPPIHPTKAAPNLSGEEKNVYEFIVRHFLACCSQDAKGFETTVEIQIASEKFSASGLVILERNYLDVYPYEKWSDKDIPNFEKNDIYQPTSIELLPGVTNPPNLLTEADLIALMEKHGIGTDATHAEHIEKIQERNYAGVQDNKFLPGKLGMGLVDGFDCLGFEFSKPKLRAGLEHDLKLICDGMKTKEEVLREQIKKYRDKFEVSIARVAEIDGQMKKYLGNEMANPGSIPAAGLTSAHSVVRKCPNCGNDMTLRQRSGSTGESADGNQPLTQQSQSRRPSGGYYIGCMGYPQCKSALWLPKEMSEIQVTDQSCNTCGPDTKLLNIKFRPGSVPLVINEDYTGCVMCDTNIKEAFNISIKSGSTASTNQNRPPPTNSRPNSTTISKKSPSAGLMSQQNNTGRTQANTSTRQPLNDMSNDASNIPACLCGEPAMVLQVRKEGPNQGRPFYKCAKIDSGKCDFFLWADQQAPAQQPARRDSSSVTMGKTTPNRQTYNNTHTPQTHAGNADDGDVVYCACNQPAKRLTVQKDGPNKGREFYACPLPRDQQCKFFQWTDQTSPSNSRAPQPRTSGAYGGGRGGGGRSGAGGKRKCGHCREEGHTKKTCPQLK